MALNIDMNYCGRIYQDPLRKRDIYINIGWNVKDKQVYPQYEPWLSPYLTEEKYNEWIDELKEVFANAPFSGNGQYCAALCCYLTMGVISCPCCYVLYKARSFQREVDDAFSKVSTDGAIIKFIDNGGASGGNWTDSKGQALLLIYPGKRGAVPGGPPLGFNIILTLPSEIQWPPIVQFAPGSSYPPPAGYVPPPGGYAPPPAGYAPPYAGYAPPPAGYAPPPAGYVPPPAGYAPPPAGYAPPPVGYVPPQPLPAETAIVAEQPKGANESALE